MLKMMFSTIQLVNLKVTFFQLVRDWIPPISKPADAAKNAEEQQSGKKVYYWDEDVYQADTGNPKTKGWVEIPEA